MPKSRAIVKKKNGGFLKMKIVVKRLQKSLIPGKRWSSGIEEISVPDDVKEGHFAVIAVDEEELKRFILPLSFLTHPSFLRLLEQAAEEYGFDHDGALTVPCRPCELERILAEQWASTEWGSAAAGGGGDWSCCETMVKSC